MRIGVLLLFLYKIKLIIDFFGCFPNNMFGKYFVRERDRIFIDDVHFQYAWYSCFRNFIKTNGFCITFRFRCSSLAFNTNCSGVKFCQSFFRTRVEMEGSHWRNTFVSFRERDSKLSYYESLYTCVLSK